MSLPQVSLLTGNRLPLGWRSTWRQHILVLALLAGCAGLVTIRDYAQARRAAFATQRLAEKIALENAQETAMAGYLALARAAHKERKGR